MFPAKARPYIIQLNLTQAGLNPLDPWPSKFATYLGDGDAIATPFANGKRQFNSAYAINRANNLTFRTVTQNWGATTGSPFGGSFFYNYTTETTRVVEGWTKAVNESRLYLRGFWRVPWEAVGLKVHSIDSTVKALQFEVDIGSPSDGSGSGM